MKKLLIASALALFSLPVNAGTVTITVVGTECTGTTCQVQFTVPNAQLTRYITAYRAALGQVKVDPACSEEPCAMRDRTAVEVVRGWAKGILQGTMNNVVSFERQSASKTASDAINDVAVPDPN